MKFRTAKIATVIGVAALGVGGVTTAEASSTTSSHQISFALQRSAASVTAGCLINAGAQVKVVHKGQVEEMTINAHGLPKNTDFDVFVTQLPNAPFGISWYQSDVNVGRNGKGSATVRGIFDAETFSVSPGGTATFPPTHQFHLGLWFNNPRTPFNLGCEPTVANPVVTPFNGEQHAGIQVLNTANFPVNKGPLSRVHR